MKRMQFILAKLAEHGVAGKITDGIDEDTDGMISIGKNVHVQVGHDYVMAVAVKGDHEEIRQYPVRTSRQITALVQDLKMAALYRFDVDPVFVLNDANWELHVYPGPNGGSIIERWRCPKHLKPSMWVCETSSPEHWVSVQPNPSKYKRFKASNEQAAAPQQPATAGA
jgi:hypothetical protein